MDVAHDRFQRHGTLPFFMVILAGRFVLASWAACELMRWTALVTYPIRAVLLNRGLASMALCSYTARMNIEWDEQKNQANIRKHGFSFADAASIFEAPMLIDLDDRFEYGEERWVGIGRLQSRIVVVVYTEPSEESIRIISLRKALSHERDAYEHEFGN